MKYVFIDTEFTDFDRMELISIGLVTNTGESLYLETNDFNLSFCNEFVLESVVPLLDNSGIPLYEVGNKVFDWLNQLGASNEKVIVMADYTGDFRLLEYLLNGRIPSNVEFMDVSEVIDICAEQARENPKNYKTDYGITLKYTSSYQNYFNEEKIQHHALTDALAGMKAFKETIQFIQE